MENFSFCAVWRLTQYMYVARQIHINNIDNYYDDINNNNSNNNSNNNNNNNNNSSFKTREKLLA